MKILQLNATSLATSIKQLNFYQDQNYYDIITLQEANSKGSSISFKNWKTKSYTTILDTKLGYGVVTMIKVDIKISLVMIY